MRHYELVTILSPMLNQEQATEAWGRIKDFITNREGEIVNERSWGTRRLAYPIRKGSYNFLEGSYYLTQFSTEKPFNRELETFLRLDERVLRSLVIVTGAPVPVPVAEPAPVASEEAPVAAASGPEVEEALAATPDTVAQEATAEEAGPAAVEDPIATEVEESPEEAPVSEVETVEASEAGPAVEEEPPAEVVSEEPSGPVSEENAEPEEERL